MKAFWTFLGPAHNKQRRFGRCNRRAQRFSLFFFKDLGKLTPEAGVLAPFHG
jgi:hypothetical protein